jgi:amidase
VRALRSTDRTAYCLERIDAGNPALRAVLALDETAPARAAMADAGATDGPLAGVPVLVKDNIDTAGLATTAGSRLLAGTPPRRDAGVVTRLRSAGAVLLGKTNLSEWGNFRSTRSTEGWSAVGGQTVNPWQRGRSPGGSSSGSAVAVAAGMAPVALGTETDGSIVCPAALNGVVGVKPETGLLPADGVVPVSSVQDTVGVLATCLRDAAAVMAALAGFRVPAPVPLVGRRFAVWRADTLPDVVAALSSAGVELVAVDFDEVAEELLIDELCALYAEFRSSLEGYLATRPDAPGSLAELVAANRADPVELGLFGQDVFERVLEMADEERALAADGGRRARTRARNLLDGTLLGVDAVLAPTCEPAWRIDHDGGDPPYRTSSTPAALAGYPNVSLPAGRVGGLPVGVSVFGPRRLVELLPLAAAVEQVLAPAAAAMSVEVG